MLICFRSITRWSVILTVSCSLFAANAGMAQRGKKKKADAAPVSVPKDSVVNTGSVQPYDKVITKEAGMYGGLLGVSKVKDRYYFQIPDSLLNRDIHVISRVAEGPAKMVKGMLNFAGDDLGDMQISFVKAPDNKLYVKQLIYRDKAIDSSANGLYRAIQNNNIQPVMSVFDIKAYGKDSAIVIDVTDYINSDQRIISGDLRKLFQAEGFQSDKSYIERVYAYPTNVDFETVKTYSDGPAPFTLRVNTSFVLLPKEPMRRRLADERIGYLTHTYNDFDIDAQRARTVDAICRWRLELRASDMARYNGGELVEPIKPIVFYIDPNTPKKWVPYLITAVNNWQAAFESAGFKNAIRAEATEAGDTTWNTRDDRFNTIIYAPSISGGIKASLITDPRSGEIIHSNIHIDHNVLAMIHDNYMVQAGNLDTGARQLQFSEEVMGSLLRAEVSAHVGIALGLVENAGASATVPVELLRNTAWVKQHGFTTSIIHGVAMNYTAAPENKFTREELLPRVGEYDRWAINWGYRVLPQFNDNYEELAYLRRWATDSLQANTRLYFCAAEREGQTNARANASSLGEDPVKASRYGILNLKAVVPQLYNWTKDTNQVYNASNGPLGRMVNALSGQFYEYLKNVAGVLGTVYYTPRTAGEKKPVFQFVPLARQKEALGFLNEMVFEKEPDWMVNQHIMDKGLALPLYNYPREIGIQLLNNCLLDFSLMKKIAVLGDRYGASNTFGLAEYMGTLRSYMYPELSTGKKVSDYHVALQRAYINNLGVITDNKRDVTNITAIATVQGHLADLQLRIKQALKLTRDNKTRAHYTDLLATLAALLDPKRPAPAGLPNLPGGTGPRLTGLFEAINTDY